MNGVINVITWPARDTQGSLAAAGGGPVGTDELPNPRVPSYTTYGKLLWQF